MEENKPDETEIIILSLGQEALRAKTNMGRAVGSIPCQGDAWKQ